jgi:hypothetical protein
MKFLPLHPTRNRAGENERTKGNGSAIYIEVSVLSTRLSCSAVGPTVDQVVAVFFQQPQGTGSRFLFNRTLVECRCFNITPNKSMGVRVPPCISFSGNLRFILWEMEIGGTPIMQPWHHDSRETQFSAQACTLMVYLHMQVSPYIKKMLT